MSTTTVSASGSAADSYVQMIDNSTPASYARTCQEAADQARRDSTEKEEEAKRLRQEAESFAALPGAGNHQIAADLRAEAARCEEDARARLAWAARLDGMASAAVAKAG